MLPYKDYQVICEYMEDIAPVHIHNSWNRIKDPYRVLTLNCSDKIITKIRNYISDYNVLKVDASYCRSGDTILRDIQRIIA